MEQELQIQNTRWRIEFRRFHLVGKAKGKKCRPGPSNEGILKDAKRFLFKARKLLKDKSYVVFEDKPKEPYKIEKSTT